MVIGVDQLVSEGGGRALIACTAYAFRFGSDYEYIHSPVRASAVHVLHMQISHHHDHHPLAGPGLCCACPAYADQHLMLPKARS